MRLLYKFLIFMIIIFLMLFIPYFFRLQNMHQLFNYEYKSLHAKHDNFKIAIILPVSHPALHEIQSGFQNTLKASISAKFDVYNADGNRVLLRSIIEDIFQKDYDLIVPITTLCATISKEVSFQRKLFKPIVFAAVDDPVSNGIVNSLASSGNNLTGTTDYKDFERQFYLIYALKPEVKRVVLVYNPNPGLEKQRSSIQKILENKNISLKTIEVFNPTDIALKVADLKQDDIILVLKDNMVVSNIDILVNICNREHIVLYASDLNSVDNGAALAFGIQEEEFGILAARQALKILVDGVLPSDIPISFPQNYRFKLNLDAALRQNLNNVSVVSNVK